jgi:hypothetical protein
MAFYFVSTFAIAQTPTKQPALRLSRTKNLHFAKATFPGFSALAVFHICDNLAIACYQAYEELLFKLSFCRLLGLGCPKQAFAKIATPR